MAEEVAHTMRNRPIHERRGWLPPHDRAQRQAFAGSGRAAQLQLRVRRGRCRLGRGGSPRRCCAVGPAARRRFGAFRRGDAAAGGRGARARLGGAPARAQAQRPRRCGGLLAARGRRAADASGLPGGRPVPGGAAAGRRRGARALEPGVAAVLPGMSLGMDPQPCSVSRLPTRTRPRGIAWTRGRPPAATVPASPSTCGRTLTCPSAAARRRGSTWRPSTAACSASTRLQPPVLQPLPPAGLAQPMEPPAAPRLPLQGPSASRSAPSQESRGVSGTSTRRRLWRS